ncbi:class I SAM-dependent methyltransferase [Saccharothrix coeruleofusca]|uniref:Methyltransferase MycE N-terminal domain-containing protein n=1 Tax=Saccharothrix coeruleofusca TaxID=33919 RepID=A0A918ECQ0_9PSEU|nr:class I SAM-dependent methyltransferase [Saccharothrix coeruleofusca]MBP2336619.1 demethylmacrocin O-methyltransferase [Saccharothrix coeruleofusca]GGP51699.1 hypothetical protein GCM10010185_24660 [Saccharothrix coeruleofusca]GGP85027.1 hypothetical protein GCM10010185_68590 [Saccharothrix coeruleofusca]
MTDLLNTEELERLIAAAGGPDRALDEVVTELGADRVNRVLVDEIAFRADLPDVDRLTEVGLDVEHGGATTSFTFTVRPHEPVRVSEGVGDRIAQSVAYSCADLVRELFGSAREHYASRRALKSRFEVANIPGKNRPSLESVLAMQKATAAVLSGIDSRPPDLGALAARYYSDKWGGLHWFTPHYERHLRGLRDEPVRVLEIGIGGFQGAESGGGSLNMWRRYFARGLVFGVDLFDKSPLDRPRVTTLRGDQNDPATLTEIARRHGPFDVVIDDGSHVNEHILTSFAALFPHVRTGGLYVIEDLWTSYLSGYGGDDSTTAGPRTGLGLVKRLVDALHHEEHPPALRGERFAEGAGIAGLHVYRNIAFIDKGVNLDGGIPLYIPRKAFAPNAGAAGGPTSSSG